MARISYGYRTLDDQLVTTPVWEFSAGDEDLLGHSPIARYWTMGDDVAVKCAFDVNVSSALSDLGLPPDSTLSATLVARSSLPIIHSSLPRELQTGTNSIYLQLPGAEVAGSVSFTLEIAVSGIGEEPADLFAPTMIGNVVLRASNSLKLEGEAPRLPTISLDFSRHGFSENSNAKWWIRYTSTDLDGPVQGSVWLWLNSENQEVQKFLSDLDDPASSIWLSVLKFEFARSLIRKAVEIEDFELTQDYPEGSLGQALANAVTLVSSSTQQLRESFEADSGFVEALLQDRMGGLEN